MKYEVIDNFLDEEYFDSLVTLFTDKEKIGNNQMSWYFQTSISYPKEYDKPEPDNKLFYMYHMFYEQNRPESPFYSNLIPLLEKLGVRSLLRIKANLYPFTETFYEHI